MLEQIATAGIVIGWLACVFVLLQFTALGQRRALALLGGLLMVGFALIALRTGSPGFLWLRADALRSDAFALAGLVPAVSTVCGVLTSSARTSPWAVASAGTASLACAFTGIAAIAVGRSGWYWEFVAVIVGGTLLAASCGWPASRARTHPNERIILGGSALFGVFLAIGGTALLLAWRATG